MNIEVPAKRSHFTPLHVACLTGNIPGIKVLLRNGADIEAVDKKDGLTPLIATFQHNHVEATKFLIEKGANIMGRRFGKGMTPLVNAIGLQREEIRQLIIDKARESPDMMGELKKQGGGHRSKAYKKRTFVLYGTYLSYYKTPLVRATYHFPSHCIFSLSLPSFYLQPCSAVGYIPNSVVDSGAPGNDHSGQG